MVKTLVSTYSPKKKELENLCLIAVHQRNCMAVISRDIEVVIRDQCFFMDFDCVVMQGVKRNNLLSNPFLSSWQAR